MKFAEVCVNWQTAGLENRWGVKTLEGSSPSTSAKF